MKIGIIGVGALGSLLGFCLSARAELWLLGHWQAQIDQINTAGLCCEHAGVEQVRYPRATNTAATIGACDVVLVAVKAQQTRWAAEQARLLQHARTLVVTLQNGLGNRELLASYLGAERVGQAVTALGATLVAPGRVRQAGQGLTSFGSAPDPAQISMLVDVFMECGLPAAIIDADPAHGPTLDSLVWSKLIVNVGINALSALLRVPNGVLASSAPARELLERAVLEALEVAVARRTPLLEADPLAHVLEVARTTAMNRSSMLQDVLRGSPSEIDAINGAIVREGQRLGIPTPVNQMLTSLVHALDATIAMRVYDAT